MNRYGWSIFGNANCGSLLARYYYNPSENEVKMEQYEEKLLNVQ